MALYSGICPTIYLANAHCAGRIREDNLVKLLREMKCRDENLEMLEIYLKEGVINSMNCDLWHINRVIHAVVDCEDEVVIRKLMEYGTLLRAAVRDQSLHAVMCTLHMLRKMNEETNYFDALHIAASKRYVFITKILLDDGANINSIDGDGRTPLFYAVKYNQFYQCRLLLRYGATIETTGPSNLFHAMFPRKRRFDVELIHLLLKAGFNPNAKGDDGGKTILHEVANNASFGGSTECAKLLIKYGANKNAKTDNGDTVLHIAANACSSAPFLRWLIRNKVDLNVRNAKKETFLDILTKKDDINAREAITIRLIKYLLVEQRMQNFEYDFERMKMTDRERLEYIVCREELDNLKKIKLNNQLPFNLFHILIWSQYRIARLRVDPGLDTDDLETRFPKYGGRLRINYESGLRRLKAENIGIELLEDILGEILGTDIVRRIVDCFSTRDLEFWKQDEN